jgi:hypothetical protein
MTNSENHTFGRILKLRVLLTNIFNNDFNSLCVSGGNRTISFNVRYSLAINELTMPCSISESRITTSTR